jgi:hypothetical protein
MVGWGSYPPALQKLKDPGKGQRWVSWKLPLGPDHNERSVRQDHHVGFVARFGHLMLLATLYYAEYPETRRPASFSAWHVLLSVVAAI